MPLKRRQKAKGRLKQVKKKGAVSDDMDSQSTQDSENQEESANKEMSIVLNRLSKKHLLNSSSEASDYAHKENIPVRIGDPYDADLETTDAASTAGESDMELSATHIKSILSPSRHSNRRTRQNSKGIVKKKVSIRTEDTDNEKDESTSKTDSALSLDTSLKHCFPKLYSSDTSTPQSAVSESKSELNDSAFGFEGLADHHDLPFSPVPTYTPENQNSISSSITTSGISSKYSSQVDSTSLSISERQGQQKRTYTVNLSCLVDGDDGNRRRTKKKKTATAQKEQVDEWAVKIGAEFNDIEMHELSVE